MSSHQHDIDLIERFFRQELSEDELVDFENKVKQDPDFSKEVIWMRDMVLGIKAGARKDLKEELQEIEKDALKEGPKNYKPKNLTGIKWTKGLFVLAVITGITYVYFDKTHFEPYKNWFYAKDSVMVKDSSLKPNDSILSVAPGGILLKDPSDARYKNTEAEFKLNVSDPKSFMIEKIAKEENGLYIYRIKADGKSHVISSTNPNLTTEMFIPKANALKDINNRPQADTLKTNEGVDF